MPSARRWSRLQPLDAGPRIDGYRWRGGQESMLRFGPADGPMVVVVLPLFEEANRLRALAGSICRALAALGVGGILPDLPGQGDSLLPLERCTLADFSDAVQAVARAAGTQVHGVAVRSGALLDRLATLRIRWHLAPQGGAELLRELKRAKQAGSSTRLPDGDRWFATEGTPVEIAGNLLSADLLRALSVHEPSTPGNNGAVRTVRLLSDAGDADFKLPGQPLWRRAEPGNDPSLAQALAADIAQWIAACEG